MKGQFGEPWVAREIGKTSSIIRGKHTNVRYVNSADISVGPRIVACVNALDGVTDPVGAVERARVALMAINRRASPRPDRTLGECADELVYITDLARAALAALGDE